MNEQNLIIILNTGGWGDGGIEKEEEAKSILEGVKTILCSWQWKYEVLAYERIKSRFSEKIRVLRAGYSYYVHEAEKLSNKITHILKREGNTKVLLLGYSAGGILNIAVMKRLLKEPRVYSMQFGTPFFAKYLKHPRVLDLRKKYDLVARGHFGTFCMGLILGICIGFIRMGLLRTLHPTKAFHVPGHYYVWADEKIRNTVKKFLKNNFANLKCDSI